ncbi:MAG: hypothetical protein CMN25_17325 [Salinicola sp.]|nr:hypothetical protein [Salinicola sp.]
MRYKIQVSRDRAGYIATCRELPRFVATSKELDDLSRLSVKNLSLIIGSHLSSAEFIPQTSSAEDEDNLWHPPLGTRLKVEISNALIDKGWSRDEFFRVMDLTPSSARNFFDIEISTRLTTFDKAFHVLGLFPDLQIIESPGDLHLRHREKSMNNFPPAKIDSD